MPDAVSPAVVMNKATSNSCNIRLPADELPEPTNAAAVPGLDGPICVNLAR